MLIRTVYFLFFMTLSLQNKYISPMNNEQRSERQMIGQVNLELTGTHTTILHSKNLQQTIIYLEFAALTLEENKKDEIKNNDHSHIHDINSFARLHEKIDQVRAISYESLRAHTIKQGDESDMNTLRTVQWEGNDAWEKEFRTNLLTAILKKRINLHTTPPIPDATLDVELQTTEVKVQLDLIEGFSQKPSLYALYQAYNCVPSNNIKRALTNHIIGIIKTNIKTKIAAIAFIGISVVFWYTGPRLQKRYPNEIRYFYELIRLIILERLLAARS